MQHLQIASSISLSLISRPSPLLSPSVATEPFPIISRLKPYLNKNASENPNYNHYLQPSPSTLEIRVKASVGFIVFAV